MLDHVIAGATVVDGTGAPGFTADVGVRGGRVVAVGAVTEAAAERIDADGLVVCPGFVDPHTHYDAQLFWDPSASPSNVHGVTSVIGGNCSFALAPLHDDDADYTRRMMARVEGMPLDALEQGVPWGWESFGGYLDALEGRIGVNAGFLAGHSALRRYVLGPSANVTAADETTLPRLRAALADALAGGALGFSTDLSTAHMDAEGHPIPAKGALPEEHLALCEVVGAHPGTTLAGIFDGGSTGWTDAELDLLPRLSATANRVLNWNLLVVDAAYPERVGEQMALSTRARAVGGRIVALVMPTPVPMTMSFANYCALFLIPGWRETMGLAPAERAAALRTAEVRRRLEAAATSEDAGMFRVLGDFGGYRIGDTVSAANAGLTGRTVADIAAERGADPFDTLIDVVLTDDLATVLWPPPAGDDDAHTALRAGIWDDPDVLLAGSDAGAHLDRMCGGSYPTQFLAECLRGRRPMSMEQAVHHFTDKPARLFGLRDRGRVVEGAFADLVVFDPATVGSLPARQVYDLPGGAVRLIADSVGVHRVFVNGVETVRDGASTGSTPGTVLRSGRDTDTVTAR
ncbi:MAG: amidohydrolase family protein [Actinomycetes bacterium]